MYCSAYHSYKNCFVQDEIDEVEDFDTSQPGPSTSGHTHCTVTTVKEQQRCVNKGRKPVKIKSQLDEAQTKIDDSFKWLNSFKGMF